MITARGTHPYGLPRRAPTWIQNLDVANELNLRRRLNNLDVGVEGRCNDFQTCTRAWLSGNTVLERCYLPKLINQYR